MHYSCLLWLKELAEEMDLFLIYVLLNMQHKTFGGKIKNKKACSFGDIGTTSFFPAKSLGGYGDGGAICKNDSETAEILYYNPQIDIEQGIPRFIDWYKNYTSI